MKTVFPILSESWKVKFFQLNWSKFQSEHVTKLKKFFSKKFYEKSINLDKEFNNINKTLNDSLTDIVKNLSEKNSFKNSRSNGVWGVDELDLCHQMTFQRPPVSHLVAEVLTLLICWYILWQNSTLEQCYCSIALLNEIETN